MRIEDVDPNRTRPDFQAAIRDDLAWLGIKWETPVLRQSERFDAYRAALRELDRLELLYPSFLKRPEVATRIVTAQSQQAGWPCDLDDACGRPYVLCLDSDPYTWWRLHDNYGPVAAPNPPQPKGDA